MREDSSTLWDSFSWPRMRVINPIMSESKEERMSQGGLTSVFLSSSVMSLSSCLPRPILPTEIKTAVSPKTDSSDHPFS